MVNADVPILKKYGHSTSGQIKLLKVIGNRIRFGILCALLYYDKLTEEDIEESLGYRKMSDHLNLLEGEKLIKSSYIKIPDKSSCYKKEYRLSELGRILLKNFGVTKEKLEKRLKY